MMSVTASRMKLPEMAAYWLAVGLEELGDLVGPDDTHSDDDNSGTDEAVALARRHLDAAYHDLSPDQ